MERKEIEEKVRKFLLEELEVEEENVRDDAQLYADMGIDSLDLVEIVVIVDREFGFRLNPEDMKEVLTLKQFCDYIEAHAAK